MRKLKIVNIVLLLVVLNIFCALAEESGENVTCIYHVNLLQSEKVAKDLEEMYSKSQVSPKISFIERTNCIVITAPPDIQAEIKAVIDDINNEEPDQINIEVSVIEMIGDEIEGLGIDWGTEGTFRTKLSSEAFDKKIWKLERENENFNLLFCPRITTISNEKANISILQDMPYMEPVEDVFYRLKGKKQLVPVEYRLFRQKSLEESEKLGIRFSVKPVILEDEQIKMDINLRIDIVVDRQTFPDAPNLHVGRPIVDKREFSTSIIAKSGEVVMIGELIKAGAVLASKGEDKKKRAIFYFVQSQIIKASEEINN